MANKVILTEENGMRPLKEGIPKVVLVITDGESNDRTLTLIAADKIKKREFNIISIGVGSINRDELLAMSTTVDDFYFVENFNKILDIIKGIARTTCQQPAEVEQETNVVSEVPKDSYRYFKYPLQAIEQNTTSRDLVPTYLDKFTLELKILSGSSDLFFSFEDKNPKNDDDYLKIDTKSDQDVNFYEDESILKRTKRDVDSDVNSSIPIDVKYYQVNREGNGTVLYFSVKGLEDQNTFEVFVYNRTVNETKNNSSNNYLLMASIVVAVVFILTVGFLTIFFVIKKSKKWYLILFRSKNKKTIILS